jgi:hypothetical protein
MSPCSLKTVVQVAEYGAVPTSHFSLLPFVSDRSVCVLQKIYSRELNRYEQHAVGKDSAARGSQGLVHTDTARLEHHTLTSASCRWHVHSLLGRKPAPLLVKHTSIVVMNMLTFLNDGSRSPE